MGALIIRCSARSLFRLGQGNNRDVGDADRNSTSDPQKAIVLAELNGAVRVLDKLEWAA
jgi:hypothetical protein